MSLKKWALWGIAALLIVTATVFYMINSNKSGVASKESTPGTALSIWLYSQGWEAYISEFQQMYPNVAIDVRYFRSSRQLLEELLASISANAAPQLAELHSYYGVAELVDTGAALPVNRSARKEWSQINPAFTAPFHYEDQDWAVPIGGAIPMLYYREELLKRTQGGAFTRWDEVERAASEEQAEGLAANAEQYWGIGVDKELPWYVDNLSFTPGGNNDESTLGLDAFYSRWSNWIHTLGIMKPLAHHRAASDFINGKIGLFISSSEMLPTVERYIGGKFQFDAGHLPEMEQHGIVPGIHGLVALQSVPAKVKAAESFITYMLREQTQAALWRMDGMIPSRSDIVFKLQEETGWSLRQKEILDSTGMFVVKYPSTADFERWKTVQSQLEQLEQKAEVPAAVE
ncbi:extracellular solute-binding protein [Paenibacillus eucommiae]|uniref:ABC-type glycerol-3-phosphate transport system substrate-binding protein n=1 Tax=Paenibacillus eucommiae TaxID=1355755 RepID=A0ABS4J6S6_9BACL|nr:extracellular solute-binding protein [Paenibacillus eucommiae]MBP1995557.1 ABC-type glycerol-3-phosphate transport system substrate-binding protein [Paenibacillus eucommiae]